MRKEAVLSSCKIVGNHFLNWVNCSSPWCGDTYAFRSLQCFIESTEQPIRRDRLSTRGSCSHLFPSESPSSPANSPATQDRSSYPTLTPLALASSLGRLVSDGREAGGFKPALLKE
jgi:hypothetical protein